MMYHRWTPMLHPDELSSQITSYDHLGPSAMVMRGWGESSPASPRDKFVVLAGWGAGLPVGSPAAPRVVSGVTDHGGFVARPAPSSVPGATLLSWRDSWVESAGPVQGSWPQARPTSARPSAESAGMVQGPPPLARPTSSLLTSSWADSIGLVQGSRLLARPTSAGCDTSVRAAAGANRRGLSGLEELSGQKRPLQPSGAEACSPSGPDEPLLDSAWRPPGSAGLISDNVHRIVCRIARVPTPLSMVGVDGITVVLHVKVS